MIDYMKKHEEEVRERLSRNLSPEAWADLLAYHDKQIAWMQHERLIHLIVTLFVCLFTLLAFGFAAIQTSWPALLLSVVFLLLALAYLIHYFRLENGVQRWYGLSHQIKQKMP
jgi:cell division protein FtsW (lipid II flippase)